MEQTDLFGTEKISRILLRLAPPVMLAQLIQALYNIVDSFFVGKYSDSGLTALSIIYPVQLLMIALAVGTGVGINTVMAAKLGTGERKEADEYAGVGTPLAIALWLLFAAVCWVIMPAYARMSTSSEAVRIRQDRLRVQLRAVSRKHLDEDPAVRRRYENADARADHRRRDQYRA